MTVIATIANIPLANYPTGVFISPAVSIPDEANNFEMDLAPCTSATPTIWPNVDTTLSMLCQVSVDGGATWIDNGGFNNAPGGIHQRRLGGEVTVDTFGCTLQSGTNRLFRCKFTIVNGPLRTSGSAVWLT